MTIYSFILLQAGGGFSGGSFIGTLMVVLFVFAISAGIFLLIRSILLWYWKVDVIVRTQESQIALLQRQNDLISEQTFVLKQMNAKLANNAIDPNNEAIRP
jgi:hypothetical protein